MDAAMSALHSTIANANNALKRTTLTGKRRKTYYSIRSMDVKKSLKEIAFLRTSWKRRLELAEERRVGTEQPNPFHSDPRRGQNRGGKHRGGEPVTLQESKKRLMALDGHERAVLRTAAQSGCWGRGTGTGGRG